MHRLPEGPGLSRRSVGRALAVVTLANLLFLALMLVAPGDPQRMEARVRTAYETGELGTRSYLRYDTRRGYFQHNDCLVLQMLSNRHSSAVERALAPRVYIKTTDHNPCAVLRAMFVERVDPKTLLLVDRFTRYWHGYNALTGFALRRMDLDALRRLLRAAVWLAIGALALATSRAGPLARRTGLTIALAAAALWGVQYFAPGLSQGPGDAVLLLGLAAIAAWPRLAADPDTIVPYAAGFGAAVVFFEMFTGQLPTGVAWLAALTLAAARDHEGHGGAQAPWVVLSAVVAFGLGAAATVLVKQILALALVGSLAPASFFEHLNLHLKNPPEARGWVREILAFARLERLLPVVQLVTQSRTLTFGNRLAGYGVIVATLLAWLAVAIRVGLRWHRAESQDLLILMGAALVPVAWAFLLPHHTSVHAWLMVRLLVVPISLAAVALFWPRANRFADSRGTS
jgi:hypothetical protein